MREPKATILGSYAYGWQQFLTHFLHVLLIGIIVGVAQWPAWAAGGDPQSAPFALLQILVAAYMILIVPVVNYGAALLYLQYMRDERGDIRALFDGFKTNYLNIILANLLVVAIIGIGVVLLIVPGIVFACRLAFVPYLVMDKGLEPVAAVEKSWNMTRGHGWRIFGMYVLAILLFTFGLLLLVVGAFFAFVWISCAFASLYYAVDREEQARLDANGIS